MARTEGARVRLCQACWPWMSTSASPASRSCAAVAALPLTQARLFPCASIVRRSSSRPALSCVGLEAGLGQPGGERGRRIELGGDLGPARAFAHHAGVAAAAEGELQGVDQDRLAGAGFAAEDGEAGAELDLEGVDDHEVADREAMQHG